MQVAERLGDPAFLAHALRMHGNELRKADHPAAAVAHLGRAIEVSADREGRGAAYALLARAAGERGDPDLFDHAISGYQDLLDSGGGRGMLFNLFTFREIQLRGLISTGRPSLAARIMETGQPDAQPVAPQWHIIERVTAGQVLLAAAGKRDAAEDALRTALASAESHRLPHQIQRTIRAANEGGLTDISDAGAGALKRLTDLLRPAGNLRNFADNRKQALLDHDHVGHLHERASASSARRSRGSSPAGPSGSRPGSWAHFGLTSRRN